jgi:hypothetical protein
MRLAWLLAVFFISVIFTIVSLIAMRDDLFWTYRWLDVPMHLFGGFIVGALAASFAPTYRLRVFASTIVVIVVGWELFEAVTKAPQESPYVTDTIFDLINGSVGAGVARLLAARLLWRSS